MFFLPNALQAIIDIRKLAGYALNEDHEEGTHKAYVFRVVLGLTNQDAAELKDKIFEEVQANPAEIGKEDQYGKRYSVKFEWTRSGRTATILTGWIVRTNENNPRLTSCYII